MTLSFLTNELGMHTVKRSRVNTHVGSWGSGSHPFSYEYPLEVPYYHSIKHNSYAAVRGDRLHCNPYYRHYAQVLTDEPQVVSNSGSDGNGWWSEVFTQHLSTNLNSYVITDPPGFASVVANAKAQCTTEALNKLKQGKVQNGADIGEARQTAGMIADGASAIFKAYKAAKRGNVAEVLREFGLDRKRIRNGKTLANAILAFNYGIKPAYGAVVENAELFRAMLGSEASTFKVTRKVQDSFTYVDETPHLTGEYECHVKVQTGLTARVSNDVINNLGRFGLINPLEVAWELTPFSFVVDWFIPIGNTLESITAPMGLDFVTGYQTTTTTVRGHIYNNGNSATGGYVLQNPGKLVMENITVIREPLFDWPSPEFYADRTPFSSTRAVNALALLRQTLLR